jgi:hypothetical protein
MGLFIYFTGGGPRSWYRVRVRDRKLERLFSDKEEQRLVRALDV